MVGTSADLRAYDLKSDDKSLPAYMANKSDLAAREVLEKATADPGHDAWGSFRR